MTGPRAIMSPLPAGVSRFTVRPHGIRHTYAVLSRKAGLDTFTRANLLNHSDTHTLQKYDHLMAGETEEARAKVRAELDRWLK